MDPILRRLLPGSSGRTDLANNLRLPGQILPDGFKIGCNMPSVRDVLSSARQKSAYV